MIDSIARLMQPEEGSQNKEISLCFKNVSYQVELELPKGESKCFYFKEKAKKKIISNLSGYFRAGQLTAIMGASGSGKTTLLNILACRINSDVQGQKFLNGSPYDHQNFGNFANYVMQKDILFQTLTVRETLFFAADLTLTLSKQEKTEKIDSLVKKLKLDSCLDTLVGGPFVDGVSGGEKKRTSIAFELISNPSVLMLDEPTSGLDSLTSFIIVQYLKDLAVNEEKTVILTIHQPNSQIFDTFDQLMLLVQGKFVYQGPAKKALNYFDKKFGLACPRFHNPADFLMAKIHHQSQENCARFPAYFQSYDQLIAPEIQIQMDSLKIDFINQRKFQVSDWQVLKILLHRDYLNVIRNPHLAKYRVFATIAVTIFTSGIFCKFSGEYMDKKNWDSLVGFASIISIGSLVLAIAPISLIFPLEKNVLLKEENAKLYGTLSYFLSRNIVQIPYAIILPLLMQCLMYWFIGLSSTPTQFFTGLFVGICMTFAGNSLGLIIGSLGDNIEVVGLLITLIMNPLILYSGYFKNLDNIPDWIGWIQYLSPIKYCFQALLQNQVQFADQSLVWTLNFKQGIWPSIGYLVVIGIGFRFMSFFFLWWLRRKLQ